jgi:hypothetical protein
MLLVRPLSAAIVIDVAASGMWQRYERLTHQRSPASA